MVNPLATIAAAVFVPAMKAHLAGLDAIRFFAALWVMIAHCLLWSGYDNLEPNPRAAVSIFMVLSGYLMAATAADFTKGDEWRKFYLRRFFRIAPVYYVVFIFSALAYPWVLQGFMGWGAFDPAAPHSPLFTDFSFRSIALHLSFLFGFSSTLSTSALLPDWSLTLEMQFYAAFPAIWLAVRRWGALRACAALGMASIAYWAFFRNSWPDPSHILLQLPYFLAGVLVFEARKSPALLPLALLFAGFEFVVLGWWSFPIAEGVLLVWLVDQRPDLSAHLDHWTIRLGADLSYAIYLTHGFFIAAGAGLPIWLLIPFVCGGTIAASYMLHRFIERPGIALGRRVTSAGRTRAVTSPSMSSTG